MSKCKYYHERTVVRYVNDIDIIGRPIKHEITIGECWGTRERDECLCEGDKKKCDFYPEKRK